MPDRYLHGRARVYYRIAALFAVPLALISLIPSLVGLVLVSHSNDKLSAQNRQLADQNRRQDRVEARLRAEALALRRLRKARAQVVARTDILMCEKQNASNDILGDLIRGLLASPRPTNAPPVTPAQLRAIALLKRTLRRLAPQMCQRLPTSEPSFTEPKSLVPTQ